MGTSDRPPAIEARRVRKVYQLSRTNTYEALCGVDFRLMQGELASIVGPSGSGKSTLMNVLSTLDPPTSGTVLVEGVDTSLLSDAALSDLRNQKIGIVFQSYNLIARMSALDNVALPLVAMGVSLRDRAERATHALESVGLAKRVKNRPSELSGGEQQRVAIARALVTEPTILLTDEPTGNLDSRASAAVVDLFETINATRGVATVLVTHDTAVAARTRRIVHIRDGRIERDEPNAPEGASHGQPAAPA